LGFKKTGRVTLLIAIVAIAFCLFISREVYRRTRSTARFDFESGDFSGWIKRFAASDSGKIVSKPIRRGRYAARFELRAGDDTGDGIRAEVKEMYCAPLGRAQLRP